MVQLRALPPLNDIGLTRHRTLANPFILRIYLSLLSASLGPGPAYLFILG